MKINALLPVIILPLLACCAGNGDNSISTPRPRAFHRLDVPPPVYDTTAVTDNIALVTNTGARVLKKRPDGPSTWVDIVYPTLGGATLYCSITPVNEKTVAAVMENRLERMALNSGGYAGELLEFSTPAGFQCRILVTGAGTATPVQFLAVSESDVVTGTLMMNVTEGFQPDSISPVVDCVTRDVEMLLRSL